MSSNEATEISDEDFDYVGFWPRFGASFLDSILIVAITTPLLILIYGVDYFTSKADSQGMLGYIINYGLPIVAVILFWIYKAATPGKIALSMKIVDAETGNKPTTSQLLIRYVGYYVSLIPMGAGFTWIAIDPKKQGWHDKMAGTVVIRSRKIKA